MTTPDYIAPAFQLDGFHCPYCGVLAHQEWANAQVLMFGGWRPLAPDVAASHCGHCKSTALWIREQLVYPAAITAPRAHADLDGDALTVYNEARSVLGSSPRAAAALLRLCLQQLVAQLGATSTNLNEAIGELVAMGMPTRLQQAMDALRVIGNNAVHPGTIEAHEDPAVALSLFVLVNTVVEQMITAPNDISAVWDLIPESQRRQIEQRDGNPSD